MSGKNKTTQDVQPWAPAIGGLKNATSETADWWNRTKSTPLYSGRFTPDNSPLRREAIGGTTDIARAFGSSGVAGDYNSAIGNYASALKKGSAGPMTFADYDPSGVRGIVDALTRPMTQQFQQEILPGIYDNLDRSGAAHNDRASIPVANAAESYARGISDTATQIGYQDFLGNRNFNMGLAQALPGLATAGITLADTPNKMLDFAGQQTEALQANDIQNALLGAQYAKDMPFQDLSRYINSMVSLGGVGKTATNVEQINPLTGILQALAAGASVAAKAGGI